MRHAIKMGICLIVSILLFVVAGVAELPTDKRIGVCMFAVGFFVLFIDAVISYLLDSAETKHNKSKKEKSDKGE